MPVPFDKDICVRLYEEGRQLLRDHPEIRSIIVAIDYYSAYDRLDTQKSVWCGRDGPVTAPDATIGSLIAGPATRPGHVRPWAAAGGRPPRGGSLLG